MFFLRKAKLDTEPLAEGFVYSEGQYVEGRAPRDFFYVTRRQADARPVTELASRG